jgi:hypothetical protein
VRWQIANRGAYSRGLATRCVESAFNQGYQGASGSTRNQDQGWGYQGSLISGSGAPLSGHLRDIRDIRNQCLLQVASAFKLDGPQCDVACSERPRRGPGVTCFPGGATPTRRAGARYLAAIVAMTVRSTPTLLSLSAHPGRLRVTHPQPAPKCVGRRIGSSPGDGWAARRDPEANSGVFYWAGLYEIAAPTHQ